MLCYFVRQTYALTGIFDTFVLSVTLYILAYIILQVNLQDAEA